MTPDVEQVSVGDPFVRDHAVPEDEAVTFAHVGIDYHVEGGYWFPSDVQPAHAPSGWIDPDAEGDILPVGELVQYPCDDRPPRMVGYDDLPGAVKDRVIERGGDVPSREDVADALFETLAALADIHKRIGNGDHADRVLDDVLSAYDLQEADDVFARTGHERAGTSDPTDFAVDKVVCSECGESHDDGACWDEDDSDGGDA